MNKQIKDDSPLSNCIRYKDYINFSIGEPHFAVDKCITDKIYHEMLNNCNYCNPQGLPELREKILKKNNKGYNKNKTIDNVLIGAGVSNLLYMVLTSYLQKGDKVLLVEPFYFSYKVLLEQIGAEYITVPERFNRDDLSSIKENIKIVLFSNPSNPTGYCMTKEQLILIDSFSKEKNALVLSDEIYADYIYDNEYTSMAEINENAVIFLGFSKSYSMTGLRLGAVIASKDIINNILILQTHSLICVPESIQWGGVVALDTNIEDRVDYYKNNRDYIYDNLKNVCDIKKPDAGLYYYLDVVDSDKFIQNARDKYHMLFADGKKFADNDSSHIRISFCVPKEVIENNVNKIVDCINDIKQ